MARMDGLIQEQGPYPQGSLNPVAVVLHRTYGAFGGDIGVARGSRSGIGFHFYVPRD